MHADASPARAGRPSSGHAIRALVNWFVPAKGYGFLPLEDGSSDVFCHGAVVAAAGHSTLPQGAAVFVHEGALSRSGLDDLQAGPVEPRLVPSA